jgi:Neuraminidase (sialidase)
MLKKLLVLVYAFCLSQLVNSQNLYDAKIFQHDSLFKENHFFYNHSPQIEIIDSGDVLPNGVTLFKNILVCSAFGGFSEGEKDQSIWISRSFDDGKNWTNPNSFGSVRDTLGTNLIWNASLFKLKNNTLVQFYMFQRNRGAGESSNLPIFLKFKKSIDGGLNWTADDFLKISGIGDTSSFRIFGPYTKPIILNVG